MSQRGNESTGPRSLQGMGRLEEAANVMKIFPVVPQKHTYTIPPQNEMFL